MRRNVRLEDISDGKLYDLNDMVKAGCNNCYGCCACCKGMGKSIVLDPLDCSRLMIGLGKSFEELLIDKLELNVVDSIILPNLRMEGEEESCVFLNKQGRCSIHSIRPGICRLFPLGRYYENGNFLYFLQSQECNKKNRIKVKVSKWIDTLQIEKNQEFISNWHYLRKETEEILIEKNNDKLTKKLNMYFLKLFFIQPYKEDLFYQQFEERFLQAKQILSELC